MTNQTALTAEQASARFIEMLVARAYDGVIASVKDILLNGIKPKSHKVNELHGWFSTLSPESQGFVIRIIEESVQSSVFGTLVLLDGLTGGYPIQNHISDFALHLQIYNNLEDQENELYQSKVRLNKDLDSNLHEQFLWFLEDRANKE